MGKAVQEFVDKDERYAIEEMIKYQLEQSQNHLRQRGVEPTAENIDQEGTHTHTHTHTSLSYPKITTKGSLFLQECLLARVSIHGVKSGWGCEHVFAHRDSDEGDGGCSQTVHSSSVHFLFFLSLMACSFIFIFIFKFMTYVCVYVFTGVGF